MTTMFGISATSESMSVFLFKINGRDTPESVAAHVSAYLNPKTYDLKIIKFLVHLVCFNKATVAELQTVDRDPESYVLDDVSMGSVSDLLLNPTPEYFKYIINRMDAKSHEALCDILFGAGQEKFRHECVYNAFRRCNVFVDRFIDKDLSYIQNIMFDTSVFEYGVSFPHPNIESVVRTSGKIYFDRKIAFKNFAEVVPTDFQLYQIHYSKVRDIVTFDATGAAVVCEPLVKWFDTQLSVSRSILSCALVVYYSPATASATVTDITHIDIVGEHVGNITNKPRWRRMEYVRKYFFDVMTPPMTVYKRPCSQSKIIFKDISSRFKFDVAYTVLEVGATKVRIQSGIITNRSTIVTKYVLYDAGADRFVSTVNVMDINPRCREFILYNSEPGRVKKNINNTVVYYKRPVHVRGYFKKMSGKIFNKQSSFRVMSVVKD